MIILHYCIKLYYILYKLYYIILCYVTLHDINVLEIYI